VVGAGGVGGYFGARLAQAGEDVVFIARGEHLRAIRERGLRLSSVQGDAHVVDARAVADPADAGPVDAVLVAVKAWQVSEVAPSLEALIGPETFFVPLENGVEAPQQLADVLGRERVLGGLCAIISYIQEPGVIRHAGYTPMVAFGELDGSRSDRSEALLQVFRDAGVEASIPEDIHVAMWRKFMFITSFSGVAAVARVPAGQIRAIPQTKRLVQDAIGEVAAVARARGIALPEGAEDETMGMFMGLPDDATASMQRDIMDGRPSELEAQNGAVVRLGAEVSVPTPTHAFVLAALLPLERAARIGSGS